MGDSTDDGSFEFSTIPAAEVAGHAPPSGRRSLEPAEEPPWATSVVVGPRLPGARVQRGRIPAWSGSFADELAGSFVYPLRRQGWITVFSAGVLFALIALLNNTPLVGGIFAFVYTTLLVGYFVDTVFRVILTTAEGSDALDDLPDFMNLFDSAITPIFRLLSIFMCGALPAGLTAFAFGDEHPLVWCALGVGVLYVPMTLIAWLCQNSTNALNPIYAIRGLTRAPAAYSLTCFLIVALSIAAAAVRTAILAIPFGSAFANMTSVYAALVIARLIGVFLAAHAERLDLR